MDKTKKNQTKISHQRNTVTYKSINELATILKILTHNAMQIFVKTHLSFVQTTAIFPLTTVIFNDSSEASPTFGHANANLNHYHCSFL